MREEYLRKALADAVEALEAACASLSAVGKWSAAQSAGESADTAREALQATDITGNPVSAKVEGQS